MGGTRYNINMDIRAQILAPKKLKPQFASVKPTTAWAEVNADGSLILPADVVSRYGLQPGVKVRLDEGENFVTGLCRRTKYSL